MTSAPGRHCFNRLFEWVMSGILLGLGVHLLIWPEAISVSSFRLIKLNGGDLMALYLVIGPLRMLALWLNGSWPIYGPIVRAVGTLFGAGIWFMMWLALYALSAAQGTPPSPGIPVYLGLLVGELFALYRAVSDVKLRAVG